MSPASSDEVKAVVAATLAATEPERRPLLQSWWPQLSALVVLVAIGSAAVGRANDAVGESAKLRVELEAVKTEAAVNVSERKAVRDLLERLDKRMEKFDQRLERIEERLQK